MTGRFDHDAEVLRQQEFARLAAATVPTLATLRFLNPTQLRARVAGMLERLGYELLTPETAEICSRPRTAKNMSSPSPPPQIHCRRRPII